MKKLVVLLVFGFSATLHADMITPGAFQVLLSVGGPVAQGSFTGLNLNNFKVDATTDYCNEGGSVRSFQYAATTDAYMTIGNQKYKLINETPMMIVFKTAAGCKAADLTDALVVGELSFVNTQFSNVKVVVHYNAAGDLEIVSIPNGVTIGQFVTQPN